jgi:hypothetical protein
MAEERGVRVDEVGFNKLMDQARALAKQGGPSHKWTMSRFRPMPSRASRE